MIAGRLPWLPVPRRGRRGKLLFSAVLGLGMIAGCSSGDGTSAQAVTGCASPAAATVVVTTALRDGRADPAPHRVKVPQGSPVMLRVEVDAEAEVHVHGYEVSTEAGPEQPGCVTFLADRSGVFDVEAHPETLLVQLEVR